MAVTQWYCETILEMWLKKDEFRIVLSMFGLLFMQDECDMVSDCQVEATLPPKVPTQVPHIRVFGKRLVQLEPCY